MLVVEWMEKWLAYILAEILNLQWLKKSSVWNFGTWTLGIFESLLNSDWTVHHQLICEIRLWIQVLKSTKVYLLKNFIFHPGCNYLDFEFENWISWKRVLHHVFPDLCNFLSSTLTLAMFLSTSSIFQSWLSLKIAQVEVLVKETCVSWKKMCISFYLRRFLKSFF